ncbi:MAG: alpha/beta hydrolase [Thermoprotei archaeon]
MREEVFNIGSYRCRGIVYDAPGIPIVFLHGYNYTSDVWRDIGLLNTLEENEIPFLAIDMPYGARSACSPHTRDPEENSFVLHEAVRAVFRGSTPILVGASLGGYVALRYAMKYSTMGLFLVAPVRVFEEELVKWYKSYEKPVFIVIGSRDDIVDIEDMEKLAEYLPSARVKVYEDARHAAYLDKPELFKQDILEFYHSVIGA